MNTEAKPPFLRRVWRGLFIEPLKGIAWFVTWTILTALAVVALACTFAGGLIALAVASVVILVVLAALGVAWAFIPGAFGLGDVADILKKISDEKRPSVTVRGVRKPEGFES